MKHLIKPLALMAALALASCSENESMPTDETRVPLAVNAGIALQTRATDAAWQPDDQIGVFMTFAGTSEVVDNVINLPYMALGDGANTAFAPLSQVGTAYFPVGATPVDIRAYYPHSEVTTAEGVVAVDVSDQSSLPKIDLMVAATDAPHTSENPDVSLFFRHRLSKMVVKIEADASAANVVLAGAELTLKGTAPKATYGLFDNSLTPGAPADIALALNEAGTKATAIVVPTAAGSGVSFTLRTAAGKTFSAALPATTALAEGTMATITIRLQQTTAVVEATITDWTEGPEVEVQTLQIDLPTDESGVPAITSFSLWKNADEAGAVLYTWTNDRWVTDKAPFYVDDITATDRFSARHTPAEGNPEKDILTAGPTAADGGRIALDFAHVNTKVTVKLLPSATVTDVSAAELAVEGLYGTGAYRIVSGEASVFLPRVLDGSERITVRIGEFDYGIALADITVGTSKLTKLEAGKAYSIALTVSLTGLGLSVTVNEWDEVSGSGNINE